MAWEFGHYRMEELIARGGMGEVHRAYDTQHDRVVAIKLLSDHVAAADDFRQRFLREARAAARLREPHVIPIHAYGEIDGRLYLDMRLVEGDDLSTTLAARGSLSPAAAVDVVGQVASALDAAHAEGLVHRDVKPSNVLVTAGGFAYLVDFGIARSMAPQADITGIGIPIGTVAYMAPERFDPHGGRVDHRVDVYSLACLLFQCLTGVQPFSGANALALMHAHLNQEPPRPSAHRPDLAPFDHVIATGLAKNPDDRFASAGALAAAAKRAISQPVLPPPATLPRQATLPAPDRRSMPAVQPTAGRRGYWWLGGGAAAVVVAALVVAAVLNWPLGTRGNQSTDQPTGTSDPPTIETTVTTEAPDLSVSAPISTPACDGRYIVVIGSAVDANRYQSTVQAFLDQYPDAKYLHAPSTGCSSLQQQFESGDDIYAVYYGPFKSKGPACTKRADVGGDSFVRRLDNTSSPQRAVSCG